MKLTANLTRKKKLYTCAKCGKEDLELGSIYGTSSEILCIKCFKIANKNQIECFDNWTKAFDYLDRILKDRALCTLCKKWKQDSSYLDEEMGICPVCAMCVEGRWGDTRDVITGKERVCRCGHYDVMKDYDLCKYCDWADRWTRKKQNLPPREIGGDVWIF